LSAALITRPAHSIASSTPIVRRISRKPFVYRPHETGRSPDDQVIDEPVTIKGWSPSNYEPGTGFPSRWKSPSPRSINTVVAKLADEVGRSNIAALADRVGIASSVNTDPAMAPEEITWCSMEMAQAYTTFANGG